MSVPQIRLGAILTLKDNAGGENPRINRFLIDGDDLVFVEEGSSNFIYISLKDKDRFFGENLKEDDSSNAYGVEPIGDGDSVSWMYVPSSGIAWHTAFHFNFRLNTPDPDISNIAKNCEELKELSELLKIIR